MLGDVIDIQTIQPGKHTTIQWGERVADPNTGRRSLALAIQTFDAYGYQRELSIHEHREAGASHSSGKWRVSAYKHPFKPPTDSLVSRMVAKALIARLLDLSQHHTTLLWNDTSPRYAQHHGFVRFHDLLLLGARPSVKLLP